MSFVPLSLPNNEAQFLETRKFQVSEICRIFRVPPHMIGDLDRATFSNIESQNMQTTSFELQQKYYEELVAQHPQWVLVKIYADMKTPSLIQFNDLRRLAGRGVS